MRKVLKITLYTICGILLLLLGIIGYISTPWGQNFVRDKAESFLHNKIKTELHIGHLGYGFPKYIVLKDVLFKDQAKDTLLSLGELKIDLNMLQLLHKNVDVQQVLLTGVRAHIYRNLNDTNYNFTYIINAFTGNKPSEPKPKDTSSSSFKIDLDRVRFDDIHVRFNDYTGGMQLALDLDHLNLTMKKLDLDKMLFHIKDLSVNGLQTSFAQGTSYLPPKPKDTTTTNLQLIADNVDLQNINFQYNDDLNKLLFALKLGQLQLQLKNFGLAQNTVDIKKLAISNSDINLVMGKMATAPAPIDTIVKKDTTEGWRVNAQDIALNGVNFKMDNNNQPKQRKGIDYSHLDVKDLALNLSSLLYTSDSISGEVKHLAVTEQSGVVVKELRTVFDYNPQGATLSKLYLETPTTTLQNHIEAHYPSLDALKKQMGSLQLKIDLENSVIGMHDVLVFMPTLTDQQPALKKYKDAQIKMDATVTGFLNNLDIVKFNVAGLGSTEIALNGRISGIPDTKKLSYNLHIAKLESSRKDIEAFVPDSLRASIRIPDRFGITGQVAGTMKDYNTSLYMASTDGLAYIKGYIAMSPGKNREKYDLSVRTASLNLGHILKQDSLLGTVTANFMVKGQSFDVKTMTTDVDGNIVSAMIKGYRYHDITLSGKVVAKHGNIDFMSADPNVRVQITGKADFSGKYAAATADIKIDSIDLHALKLYSSELRASGVMHADFPELNPDYPKGTFVWWQPVVTANGKRYYLDSLYVVSRPSADTGQNIFVNMEVFQATIKGKTPLSKIGDVIQEHINRHYTSPSADSANKSKAIARQNVIANDPTKIKAKDTAQLPADYNLQVTAHVLDRPLLHSILPGLTSFDSIHIDGSVTPRNLSLNVIIPNVVYGTNTLEKGYIKVRGTDSAFTYSITADKIKYSSFSLWNTDIHGNLDNDKITTQLSISDSTKKEMFALAANMQKVGDSQIVQLQPGLKLNYKSWDVAQPNEIVLVNGGFYIRNFMISSGGQSIKANSDVAKVNTPIKVDISNFALSNITDIASTNDTALADGILSGNVTLQQLSPDLKLTSDLQIQNLSVMGDTIGDLKVQVANKDANSLAAKVTIQGNGNDIGLDGTYYLQTNNGNDFNFNLDVNALALHSFETLAMKQIKNSTGFIRGKLQLQGTASAPKITGELHTDNLATTVSELNARFKMPAEKIEFAGSNITFSSFTIHDSADNKAVINGNVNIQNLKNPDLNMTVKANNWRALHSTIADNKMFYGDLLLTANLNIKGTPAAPAVDGELKILKGTNVTVTNPESTPEIETTQGIVVFVNMKDTARRNILAPHKTDSVKHKMAAGSDINVNISVDKTAKFTLVIDQASGDFLNVSGEAALNASVAPGGNISLTGSYSLNTGAYQLNYNFIKRKFTIKSGSVITFAGDPVKGTTMDITAVYETETAPYDLVQREVTDQTQHNYYKQRIPFDVDLYMKGPVLMPQLTFNVELPENQVYRLSSDQVDIVQGKLSQVRADTSELNKQVFALLILNRFVSDDPFSSGAGTSTKVAAMQSVSTFIGEQLNQAAGKFVKGVDFSVDLATTEDYTTGDMRERTDLNLAASKQLLNDRLKLTIGNDFELEGPQTTNQQSSYLPSNLAADYLLSADGKYTMRAYRKAYDEGVLQGFVTETGLDFIVSLDYNRFKNVFKKKKKPAENTNK